MSRGSPRRPALMRLAAALLVAVAAFPPWLHSQAPTDQSGLPAPAEGSPAPGPDGSAPAAGADGSSVLPPYAPSNNAASGLLPANPPLPPHPSIPDPSLLPSGTPSPAATPFPLPFQAPSDNPLAPATPGAPGTTPLSGGATTTNVSDAARRFQYAFRLSTGVTYDDNVFLTSNGSSPGTRSVRRGFFQHDVNFAIDPSVSLGYGDFLTRATNYVEFDYTADILFYQHNTDQDTVQHSFNLQGAYHFGQFTLTLSQGIQLLSSTDLSAGGAGGLLGNTTGTNPQVNLDASRRTAVDIYTTHVDLNRAFTDKTSIDLDGAFSASEYETLISSEALSGDFFLNYSPTGKLTIGLGASGSYLIQTEPAPDEFYQQLNLRVTYPASAKLNVAGTVGVEFRETSGVDRVAVSPVFNLDITYSPFDSTSLSLVASRNVQTSAVLIGQNFDSTGFSFSVGQRFFQRANLRFSVGYTNSAYTSSGRGSSVNRTDDYYFVQPSLDYSLRDNLSVGVFYTRRQSFSTLAGNSFSDDQVGAHLSFSF